MTPSALLRLAFGKVDSVDHRRRRFIAIFQGVVTGIANRLVGIVVSFLSVPLTIGYLGEERYGVWALVGSVLAWLRLADIGIGNGLNNAIATALGAERHDLVRNHVSTGLAALSLIALLLGLGVAAAWPWIDWSSLFNVKTALARSEVGPAMAASLAVFLLGFPLSVISRVYTASQDGKLANYWGAAGNVASLLALLAVTRLHGGLVWLIVAISGTGLAMNALSGVWLFIWHKPQYSPRFSSIRLSSTKNLLSVGVQFFLIQIMALVVFETDNLVVAHYLGADNVPTYSLTYKLFGYITLIQSFLFNYVWVAYSEAISRGDMQWVRRTFRMNVVFSLGSAVVMVLPLILIARPFIRMWAGNAVVPSFELVLWMAGWTMINALCSPISCLLAAAAHMKAQLVYSTFSTIANIALSVYLVQHWGVTGVIAATVIAYMAFVCIPAVIDTKLLLRKLCNAV